MSASTHDEWESQVVEGLASADIAGALAMILESVAEEGAETTDRKLASCLKKCINQHGANDRSTRSVQLGVTYAKKLGSLSNESVKLLLKASEQSSKGYQHILKGRPESSLAPLKTALKIRNEILGEKSLSSGLTHANLGSACANLLDFGGAKYHLEIASRCWKESAFEIHPFNSVLISNKAAVATMLGVDSERLKLFTQARDIALATSGKQSLDYLYPQVELASLLIESSEKEQVLPLIESLEPLLAKYGKGHVVLNLTFLRIRVISLSRLGNQIERNRAIDNWIDYATDNISTHPAVCLKSLSTACYFLLDQGRDKKAKGILAQVEHEISLRKTDSLAFCKSIADLGLLEFHIGNRDKALDYLNNAVATIKLFMEGEQFLNLNERAQRDFKIGTAWVFNIYFHVALSVGASAEEISDIALFWKGLTALNSASGNPIAVETQRIVDDLEEGAVFVNIVEFAKAKSTNSGLKFLHEIALMAVVIEPGKEVRVCELGPSKKVQSLVEQWRAGVSNRNATFLQQQAADRAASQLKEIVWDPLALDLPTDSVIYISPDASLGAFSFDVLPSNKGDKEGRMMIEDYRILHVPIPRLLKGHSTKIDSSTKYDLVAFGDIDFGKRSENKADQIKNSIDKSRSFFDGGNRGLGSLAHSKTEIRAARQLFPENRVFVRQGKEATEATMRKVAGDSAYLLISSHAICEWKSYSKAENVLFATPAQRILSNLDLKSGIALANANQSLSKHKDRFTEPLNKTDGMLYSKEIEKLDLSRVKVAILSACSTGNGAPSAGEGLIGLSRSFQIAGVEYSVATLWNVNDEATAKITPKIIELMRSENLSPLDAVRQAKLWAISHRKKVMKIDSPRYALPAEKRSDRLSAYYWAPFVVSGNLPLRK